MHHAKIITYEVEIRKIITIIRRQKVTREESLIKISNTKLLTQRNIRETVIRISSHSFKAVNRFSLLNQHTT